MSKRKGESFEELDARMERFNKAKERYEQFDTGIWRHVPDALYQKQQALEEMWENANGPAPRCIR